MSPAAAAEGVSSEIEEINSEVQRKREEVRKLNDRIEHYRSLILEKKIESASLEDQMNLIESQIAKTRASVEISEKEIQSIELQVNRLDKRIGEAEEKMSQERQLLSSLVRKVYRQRLGANLLEILLTHDTFSGFFNELYTVISLQRRMGESLAKISDLKKDLEKELEQREEKKVEVSARKLSLEADRRKMQDELYLKSTLLTDSISSELEYRYMLAELKREQSEADSEITSLERTLRDKQDLSDRLSQSTGDFSWPVNPTRGISALFHDPDYPYRNVFEHPGIDIRAYQGTPVRAVSSGVVGRAKNAGMGYSYVLLLHGNDLSSVYGHLSKIVVKEDTYVESGEVIGYSGGMPGTPGAGQLTTGPHLHFEIRLRGIPVNPLNYLSY